MTNRIATQAAALALALLTTVAMLTSMNSLATQPHHESIAKWESPVSAQVVVVVGKRASHG